MGRPRICRTAAPDGFLRESFRNPQLAGRKARPGRAAREKKIQSRPASGQACEKKIQSRLRPRKKNPVTPPRRRAPLKKIQSRLRPAGLRKKNPSGLPARPPRRDWIFFWPKNPVTPVTGFFAVRKIRRTDFSHGPRSPGAGEESYACFCFYLLEICGSSRRLA